MEMHFVNCPRCNARFMLSDALANQTKVYLEKALQKQQAEMEKEFKDKLEAREIALAEREKDTENVIHKAIESEHARMEAEIAERLMEKYHLKDLEKDERINELLKEIGDLQRKAVQGSNKQRGDAGEINLHDVLTGLFPKDDIKRVHVVGDVFQSILSPNGRPCASILWEAKNTMRWQPTWVQKALEDQKERKSSLVVIVTTTMPPNTKLITTLQDVWVVDVLVAPMIASVFRTMLLKVAEANFYKTLELNQLESIRKYLLGDQFSGKVKRLLEENKRMTESVMRQKQVMGNEWRRMENLIETSQAMLSEIMVDFESFITTAISKPAAKTVSHPSTNQLSRRS